jgi:hypothetical protein
VFCGPKDPSDRGWGLAFLALVGDGSNRILAQQVGWPDLARNFCAARFASRSFCMVLFVLWPTGRASANLFFFFFGLFLFGRIEVATCSRVTTVRLLYIFSQFARTTSAADPYPAPFSGKHLHP